MPAHNYTQELRKRYQYFAAWEPGLKVTPGTIGVLDKKIFIPRDHLNNLGIEFSTETSPAQDDHMSYKSSGDITVNKKISGDSPAIGSALGEAQAGFSIDFSKEKMVLFEADGITRSRISDQISVGEQVEDRFKAGSWNKDWVIVTEVINATNATIMVSNAKAAHVDLVADTSIGQGDVKLAKVGLGLQVAKNKNMETVYTTDQGCNPLFRLAGIKKPIFGSPGFDNRGDVADGESAEAEPRFRELDPEED